MFPFSKAYEGFLKRLFLDLNLIREDEYYGDEIRIGRVLNPGYVHEHQNVFEKLIRNTGADGNNVSLKLWEAWKKGRDQVFHSFPHNYRKLSYDEAIDLIKGLVSAMEYAVGACNLKTNSLL